MEDTKNHRAIIQSLEDLDVVVVDDLRFTQMMMRTILLPLRLKRLRFYDTVESALKDMRDDPPNLLITDWRIQDKSGRRLVKALRDKHKEMAAKLPLLVTMSNPTRTEAEEALRCGAKAVIAKPFSQNSLQKRVQWIAKENRELKAVGKTT